MVTPVSWAAETLPYMVAGQQVLVNKLLFRPQVNTLGTFSMRFSFKGENMCWDQIFCHYLGPGDKRGSTLIQMGIQTNSYY